MSRQLRLATIALIAAACAEPQSPTGLPAAALDGAHLVRGGSGHGGAIIAHDSCDPETFNAVVGPGTCVKPGRTTFQEFIAELQATQTVRSWFFNPPQAIAHEGADVLAHNVGGEEHTFTPVREFGGGFIPDLNALSGNPVPAPECLNFAALDFVHAGGRSRITAAALAAAADADGLVKIECCIHPWMRSTVQIK